MSIFTSAKAKLAAKKLAEEQLYEFAAEEIAANNIRPGLWAKAIAESDGDDAKAKARYITLRVETMKAEADLSSYVASQLKPESPRQEPRRTAASTQVPPKPSSPKKSGEEPTDNLAVVTLLIFAPMILLAVFIFAKVSG